jgi:deoxyribonuclease-4
MRQVYEIKLTGQVKENWLGFVFQAFAYAAICPKVREVNIVLPLQDLVWTYDVSGWTNRDAYWSLMNELSEEIRTVAAVTQVTAANMCHEFCVGCHLPKRGGSFANSIAHIQDGSRGWQLFLSSNMTAKVSMKPDDIKATRAHIDRTGARIYIHSPYIINLCAVPGEKDDYHTGCLCATLDAASAMGCKGVVVHVGKSTTQDLAVALENMKTNVRRALESATPECPILLETPAGQGTETLKTYEEFVGFVKEINDPRLKICVDTCHVFACGHSPLEYIERMLREDPGLLKLIHFNDSLGECGSCVDRHAGIGLGKIGIHILAKIADMGYRANVPCVIE